MWWRDESAELSVNKELLIARLHPTNFNKLPRRVSPAPLRPQVQVSKIELSGRLLACSFLCVAT
jgi:hypothetical protein